MPADPKSRRRNGAGPSEGPSRPPIRVNVRYFLGEKGRRESLRNGGDGKLRQEVWFNVPDDDLDAFPVDEDGAVALDLTSEYDDVFGPPFELPAGRAHWRKPKDDAIDVFLHWDVVPTWNDIVDVARAIKKADEGLNELVAKNERDRAEAIKNFLADQSARATAIERDYVVIGGYRFKNTEGVAMQARKRAADDHEEAKKANRATLGEWIQTYGTDNQRQRLAAGLLPWKEAFDEAEESFFMGLADLPLYERFDSSAVCRCFDEPCEPKFSSFDAVELTAQEWDQFEKVKAAARDAQFQLREHRAQCESEDEPTVRRGVIVKYTYGTITFKRQYALTLPEVEG
jgi:hypothetical protein